MIKNVLFERKSRRKSCWAVNPPIPLGNLFTERFVRIWLLARDPLNHMKKHFLFIFSNSMLFAWLLNWFKLRLVKHIREFSIFRLEMFNSVLAFKRQYFFIEFFWDVCKAFLQLLFPEFKPDDICLCRKARVCDLLLRLIGLQIQSKVDTKVMLRWAVRLKDSGYMQDTPLPKDENALTILILRQLAQYFGIQVRSACKLSWRRE